MPTVNCGAGVTVKEVTVRQTPLTAIESPRWQSESRVDSLGKATVREVPPVESLGLSSAMTERGVN